MKYNIDKLRIQNIELCGIASALVGMRNPYNSWNASDSRRTIDKDVTIGPKDMILAQKLVERGSEHSKFLRQIQVWADFEMPRYWWAEFDTYKFHTSNSTSTMHKLMSRELTPDDFISFEEDEEMLGMIINYINQGMRIYHLEEIKDDKELKDRMLISCKRMLPESYIQLRTVNVNYAELMNVYHQRKNHRLKEEWGTFCTWCESLPYFRELCITPIENKQL